MQCRKILSATAPILLLFLHHSATAQNQGADSLISEISSGPAVTYTIQQCIDSALKNNANVKAAEFIARNAHNALLGQVGTALPTLSGYAQFVNNGGRSVNTVTYTYVTENYNQGYGQLGGNWILFNGFSVMNFIKQYSLAYRADKKDWQYQKDLITITIIQDYLAILGSEEQLDLAEKQADDIRHRTDLMTVQDSLGSIAHSAMTDQLASLDAAELVIVNTKNAMESYKLKLATDMNIPYSPNLDVAKLNIAPTPALYNATVDQVYQNATHNIASIEAAELHVQSAKKGVAAARGNMSPTLGLTYGLQSNFSTAATGVSLGTQLNNNLQTSFGLTLNIPILNGLRYRVAYKNALVFRDQMLFNQKVVNTSLRQAVESNFVTMTQNFRTYNVTWKEVQNYEESYREAKVKFDNGYISSLDFVIYNTNKNNAELNLIAAKYSYLLSTKVLDYYEGTLSW